jgi:glycosyltransferase involved in cell wall biosynthesis
MPFVTILLPNYNNARFLKEAIDSILLQTFQDFELLIVDDCSTDNGVEIIQSYSDKRIKLIRKDTNSGIVDTLNIGLDQIDSKYMARMDGDDISYPQRCEKIIRFLENNPLVGVCSSALETFGVKDEVWPVETDPDMLKAGLIRSVTTPHAPSVFRMDVLNKHQIRYQNGYPHLEDYNLFFRLRHHTNFHNLKNVLYRYRILEHNVTVRNRATLYERYKIMYKEVLNELKIETTAENLQLHLELCHTVKPTMSVEALLNYKKMLIEKNTASQVYPESAFNKFVELRWNSLFCRMIDVDKKNYDALKKLKAPISIKQKYYYFRSK